MSNSITTKGLVLSRRNYGEADRLVTLYTEEGGLLKAIAKGVRKIPSRRGGHLEPLTEVWVMIGGKKDFSYITSIETIDYFSDLHRDAEAQGRAAGHALAIVKLLTEEEADLDLYRSIKNVWHQLTGLKAEKRDAMDTALLLTILRKAGIAPEWQGCLLCGKRLAGEENQVWLDVAGGWWCGKCGRGGRGAMQISGRCLKVVVFLSKFPDQAGRLAMTLDEGRQIKGAIGKYVELATP